MTEQDFEILTFSDLAAGLSVTREMVWTTEHRDLFVRLTRDTAPVHLDSRFARESGFEEPILHGLLLASGFSEIVGCVLPGPRTIIQSVQFSFVSPAHAQERLIYRVEVQQLSAATKTVVLTASISRPSGELIVRGRIQCGFLG
jgi:acyl dehydratase